MKRLEIPASLAEPTGGGYRLEIEKAADEHKPALRSLAQALYDNKIFGVYLQQVAVAREQLYFIKVETRPAADTDQPSITMTLDAVKPKDFMKDHIKVKEDPSLLDMYTKDITVYYDAQMPTKLTVTGKSWADYDKLVVTKALEYIPEADRQLLGAMKFVRVTTLPKKQGERKESQNIIAPMSQLSAYRIRWLLMTMANTLSKMAMCYQSAYG